MNFINMNRVRALVTRHLMSWPRSLERVADAFWWPTLNLVTWGLVNVFLQKQTGATVFYVQLFLGGLLMWTMVGRAQEEMGILFLQEAWDRNLLNIFSSPITIAEFSAATIALSLIKLMITFVWMSTLSFVLFTFNIFSLGWLLIPYAILLVIFGWSLGFFINGLIIRYGYRVQVFAWTLSMAVMPFSAVYFPLSSLPQWMQYVGRMLPTTYIFEGMRSIFATGRIEYSSILVALILTLIYLGISVRFFIWSYRKAQESGMIMKFS